MEAKDRPLTRRIRTALLWVTRRLAPADEALDAAADLDEESAALARTHGASGAVRWLVWQVAHSAPYWIARRLSILARTSRWSTVMIHRGLATDVRQAARRLLQTPGFTLLAALTLALGIGATATVYTLAYGLWFKPLPYARPDRLVSVYNVREQSSGRASLSGMELAAVRTSTSSFEDVAGLHYGAGIVRVNDEPARIVAYRATPNLFRVLGVHPVIGRDFVSADAQPGSAAIILSHAAWVSRFGRDPHVLARTLTMSGTTFTIIGVLPQEFRFPQVLPSDVWIASDLEAYDLGTFREIQTIGRLAPGRTIDDAAADVAGVSRRLAATHPDTNSGWSMRTRPADERAGGRARRAYALLLALVGLFLTIACANLAGLLLARTVSRRTELALCLSLGATRWRLGRQLLVESALLAVVGCAAGLLISINGAPLLGRLVLTSGAPALADVRVSARVVAFSALLSTLAALAVALFPVAALRRVSPSESLAGSRTVSFATGRLQQALVVAEIALAMVLVVGAGVMVRSFIELLGRDRGFDPHGVVALNVTLPSWEGRYQEANARRLAFERILDRLEQEGIGRAGVTTGFPGSRLGAIGVAALTPPGSTAGMTAVLRVASSGYFDAMGIALERGRLFSATDTAAAPRAAVVNETIARAWPDGNPVGHTILLPDLFSDAGGTRQYEIVGVVEDMWLYDRAWPAVFVPFAQVPPFWVDLVVRASGDPVTAARRVRQTLRSLEPDLLLENDSSLQTIVSDSLRLERAQSAFAVLIGVLAMTVAAVGLYAQLSWLSVRRRREIGIRLALGSPRRRVFGDIFARGMLLTGAGILAGSALTALVVTILQAEVFGLSAAGAGSYALGAALLLAVATLAIWIPARRTMQTDPIVALRTE